MTLSLQLLWNYWSDFHETWYVDRTSYGVMHVGRKFWSPHFCWSYAPWNLENIRKSTNNLVSFLCQFFINEITASDAGPDIIRSHLFQRRGRDGGNFGLFWVSLLPKCDKYTHVIQLFLKRLLLVQIYSAVIIMAYLWAQF